MGLPHAPLYLGLEGPLALIPHPFATVHPREAVTVIHPSFSVFLLLSAHRLLKAARGKAQRAVAEPVLA
jgi:hypothetical protein